MEVSISPEKQPTLCEATTDFPANNTLEKISPF